MTNNFNINSNFEMPQFQNSINDFNKVFSNSVNNAANHIEGANNFDEIFKSINNSKEKEPLKANAQFFIGMDSISAQKVENLSPVAQMTKDIQTGFSNSLNNLNATAKEAEHAVETFASGGDISIHDVMIASQKSSLAMQMAVQLRSQLLNAYNEFKNMGI